VVRGMTDHRSNAFVEAMNELNFIAVAHLRLSRLKHLPDSSVHAGCAECHPRLMGCCQ